MIGCCLVLFGSCLVLVGFAWFCVALLGFAWLLWFCGSAWFCLVLFGFVWFSSVFGWFVFWFLLGLIGFTWSSFGFCLAVIWLLALAVKYPALPPFPRITTPSQKADTGNRAAMLLPGVRQFLNISEHPYHTFGL